MERLLKESELVVIGMLVETKVSPDNSISSDLLPFSEALVAYESSFKVLGIVCTHTKNQLIEPTAQVSLRHFYWDSRVFRSKVPALFSGMIEKTIEVDLESGKILHESDKGAIMMLFLKRHGTTMQFEPVTGDRWPTLSMRSL